MNEHEASILLDDMADREWTDEDYINDEELLTRPDCVSDAIEGMPHLYNVCPRCGTMDDYGLLATADSGWRPVIKNYSGFHFTQALCVHCWEEYNHKQTQMCFAADVYDALIMEHFDHGFPPTEYFRRGLITEEEYVQRMREYVDKIIHFVLYGLPEFD